MNPLLFLGSYSDCRKPRLNFSHCSLKENERLHRISSFKEWLRGQKINEGLNPETSINDKHRRNNVYGFAEYGELLQEAYCTLQFDHYNSVIDKCLNELEREVPGLKFNNILELAKKKVKGDDGEDCIDSYLYKLAATQMKDEPIKIQDTELDDNSTDNDHVLMAARNLFLYHIISDIKKRFNYDDMK